MFQQISKCYQTFLNRSRFKIITFFFLFVCSSNFICQQRQTDRELFNNELFSNKRVQYILKTHIKKKEILISDKDSLMTNKSLNYSNAEITIILKNKVKEADLHVTYYIVNPDLAYVSFWENTNEAISFLFGKKGGKWIFFDYSIRETL